VRFKATSGPAAEYGASVLVWTTTPWTLVSNTAIAVNPTVNYQVVEITSEENPDSTERIVVAENLVAAIALSENRPKVLATFVGSDFERSTYQRPFDLIDIPDAHFVILADYVTIEGWNGSRSPSACIWS
jgi:isoleucyl-tRNA synthetase